MRPILALIVALSAAVSGPVGQGLLHPDDTTYTADAAAGMIRTSQERLLPVYAPLAQYIVDRCELSRGRGIGIDLGSGPGSLILELCKRTELYWINADINPHFFAHFYEQAQEQNMACRVGAVFADAHALPFKDDYADVVVSRGSYHFWKDKEQAFREIRRVLKPGGTAFIGRGFPPGFDLTKAQEVRSRQKLSYDVKQAGEELHTIMKRLGIENFEIIDPAPSEKTDLIFGVWVCFHKAQASSQQPN